MSIVPHLFCFSPSFLVRKSCEIYRFRNFLYLWERDTTKMSHLTVRSPLRACCCAHTRTPQLQLQQLRGHQYPVAFATLLQCRSDLGMGCPYASGRPPLHPLQTVQDTFFLVYAPPMIELGYAIRSSGPLTQVTRMRTQSRPRQQ